MASNPRLPGQGNMQGYGGQSPQRNRSADDDDPAPTPPVEDNPDALPPSRRIDAQQDDDDSGRGADDGDGRDDTPQGPPADAKRDAIFDRFAKRAKAEADGEDGEDDGSAAEGGSNQRAEPGEGDDDGDEGGPQGGAPAPMTLVVNGKTLTKTMEEVARLADLSVEEVQEDPTRAIRYAQRELATTERLEDARRVSRDATPASPGKGRTAATAPNQGDGNADGQDADEGDGEDRDTTDLDYAALAEAIQIDDPKVAGKKLREAIELAAEKKAAGVVTQTQTDQLVRADRNDIKKAMDDFAEAHPELKANKYVSSAVREALFDEYREDLVEAMVAEGVEQSKAREYVNHPGIPLSEIANAHQQRRLRGDPHVRKINLGFIEAAYGRVAEAIGSKQNDGTNKGLAETRRERKANLSPQPRRASVPPTTRTQQADKPLTRSSVVAEMKQSRGQRTPASG